MKEVSPNNPKAIGAIKLIHLGEKPDLEALIESADIFDHPSPTDVEAIVITPAHRENSIEIFDQQLPRNILPIVHINDHRLGVHSERVMGKNDRFIRRAMDPEEIRKIDRKDHIVIRQWRVAYEDLTAPPLIITYEKFPDGKRRRILKYILGPVIRWDDSGPYFVDLYQPGGLLDTVDTLLAGRMKNLLLQDHLRSLPIPIIIIDTSHIRDLEIFDNKPYSIGRARALPVKYLLDATIVDLDTPIFWNDADAFPEPGALAVATSYYKNHSEVMAMFFPRRAIVPNEGLHPYKIVSHALSELKNFLRWLKEKEPHYMGGPQISSRLATYTQMLKVVGYCPEGCHEDECEHVRPTYSATLLEMLANCPNDEDFSFVATLLQMQSETQKIVWVPQRVWIHNRGKERRKVTAINGDAGNEMYEYPEYLSTKEEQEDAVVFITEFLRGHGISVSVRTLPGLIKALFKVPEFAAIYKDEWEMYKKYGLSMVSEQYIHRKPTYKGGTPIREIYKIAVQIYSLQTFLITIALRDTDPIGQK